jgi:hypothetical protein
VIGERKRVEKRSTIDPRLLYHSVLEVQLNRHFFHADMRITPDLSA